MPYVNSKSIKSVSLEKLRWQKIVRHIATKSIFDCRNKFVQILQMVFRNTEGLDEVLIKFLEKQNVKEESSVNWKKWKPKDFTPEEARNRLMILKKLIEGRSNKEFTVILEEIRNKVNKKKKVLSE